MSLPDCAATCLAAFAEKREDDMCDDCYDEQHLRAHENQSFRPESGDA